MDQSHTVMSSKIQPIQKAMECTSWRKTLEEFPIFKKLLRKETKLPKPFMIIETYNQKGMLTFKKEPTVYHKA